MKRIEYKGYLIEEWNWEVFLGGKSLGCETTYFICEKHNNQDLPMSIQFLKRNGQSYQINSIATAKRLITKLVNRKE